MMCAPSTIRAEKNEKAALTPHHGQVFVDSNGNGVRDKGEKALQGIRVSDGLNVTETAADGTYTLPGHERERFVFITTPSGYLTLNRHYHPITAEAESYDFGLIPYDAGIPLKENL